MLQLFLQILAHKSFLDIVRTRSICCDNLQFCRCARISVENRVESSVCKYLKDCGFHEGWDENWGRIYSQENRSSNFLCTWLVDQYLWHLQWKIISGFHLFLTNTCHKNYHCHRLMCTWCWWYVLANWLQWKTLFRRRFMLISNQHFLPCVFTWLLAS